MKAERSFLIRKVQVYEGELPENWEDMSEHELDEHVCSHWELAEEADEYIDDDQFEFQLLYVHEDELRSTVRERGVENAERALLAHSGADAIPPVPYEAVRELIRDLIYFCDDRDVDFEFSVYYGRKMSAWEGQ